MSDVSSVFSVEKILLTAAIAWFGSCLVLMILRRYSYTTSAGQLVILGLVVGVSVFGWRMPGNVPQLNDDPIPPFSPNDLLSPVVTYVLLGIYAAFYRSVDQVQWEKIRAWLTLISL